MMGWLLRRFRKPADPYHATLEMVPGKTSLDLTVDGVLVASVILNCVTRWPSGKADVEFLDLSYYMKSRCASNE